MSRGGAPPGGGIARSSRYQNVNDEIEAYVRDQNLPGYPLYYTQTGKFLSNGQSAGGGLRGSEARVQFTLANFPHLIFGVLSQNIYEVPDDFLDADPDYYVRQVQGGINDAQTLNISLTQQNVTSQPTPVAVFSGAENKVFRPWPTIYFFRGGNQATISARRLVQYPRIRNEAGESFRPEPEILVTLVTVQLNSDFFPGSGPGSTDRP